MIFMRRTSIPHSSLKKGVIMSWTPQQEEALRIRNKNLLLSAAAGSGKTAVLTERITRLAADPESHTGIHELLVLTFTKAAASEMKSRISASLTRELEAADAAKDLPLVRHLGATDLAPFERADLHTGRLLSVPRASIFLPARS